MKQRHELRKKKKRNLLVIRKKIKDTERNFQENDKIVAGSVQSIKKHLIYIFIILILM